MKAPEDEFLIDVKSTQPIDSTEYTEEFKKSYMEAMRRYTEYASFRSRRSKQMQKDPLLVIKNRKAKRRESNKSRKINQAKARKNKFTR